MNLSSKTKLIIAASLGVFALILFILKPNSRETQSNDEKSFSAEEYRAIMPAEIDSLLFSFGIKKEWINGSELKHVSKTKDTASANLWVNKLVQVPVDISVASINFELQNLIQHYGLTSNAQEDPKTRNLKISLSHPADSLHKVLGIIELQRSSNVRSDAARISVVLTNLQQYKKHELENILSSVENFTFVLPLDLQDAAIQNMIMESEKDYVLYYKAGNENDIEADFRTDMNEKQWKSKVKSVSAEFPGASGVFIGIENDVFEFGNAILLQMQQYRKNVFRDTIAVKFEPVKSGKDKIYDLFSSVMSLSAEGKKNIIYMVDFSYDDYLNFVEEVKNLRRRGYKFVSFGSLINNSKFNLQEADTLVSEKQEQE